MCETKTNQRWFPEFPCVRVDCNFSICFNTVRTHSGPETGDSGLMLTGWHHWWQLQIEHFTWIMAGMKEYNIKAQQARTLFGFFWEVEAQGYQQKNRTVDSGVLYSFYQNVATTNYIFAKHRQVMLHSLATNVLVEYMNWFSYSSTLPPKALWDSKRTGTDRRHKNI